MADMEREIAQLKEHLEAELRRSSVQPPPSPGQAASPASREVEQLKKDLAQEKEARRKENEMLQYAFEVVTHTHMHTHAHTHTHTYTCIHVHVHMHPPMR